MRMKNEQEFDNEQVSSNCELISGFKLSPGWYKYDLAYFNNYTCKVAGFARFLYLYFQYYLVFIDVYVYL